MPVFDFTTYLSPFTWRYGSQQMRKIWSEIYKRQLWRKIWVAIAKAQHKEGLVSKEELDDLIKHKDNIDIEVSHEIEKEIHHDLMAEIKTYASQAKIGGGKLHLGATSMDIEDNADAVRQKEALVLVEKEVCELLRAFSTKIETYEDTVCMAYTHLQPAEPTTLGYRFAFYAQDLLFDLQLLHFVKSYLKGKGLKGAVGTSASYSSLIGSSGVVEMEEHVMNELGIKAVDIANQTAPRKIEYFVSSLLSSIAQTMYKFAFDLRIMQSPGFSEWQEPFGQKQVGSSAMPFKKNPIKAEQICSLARLVSHLSEISRDNAAHMLLERTLDDSANRRVYIPEMFLAVDEILRSSIKIVNELVINQKQIAKNLALHGPFAATEKLMMEAVKRGADRQEIHEAIRENSIKAYDTMQETDQNPLQTMLEADTRITKFIPRNEIPKLLDPTSHIGLAPVKCNEILAEIAKVLR
jgi:adenylosuccinate lyase